MSDEQNKKGPSSGPLRLYRDDDGKLCVVGFGLRFEVKDEQEGRSLITELEEECGYKSCI
jgi:hypothetical protein